MFTGIIEEVGTVEALEPAGAGARLRIRCRTVMEDAKPGASIAVNGVCLTATALSTQSFTADVAPETMRRSNLGDLGPGSPVNLERPLSPSGRLGGHIVQGHIDATGELVALDQLGDGNWWLTVEAPAELDPYLVFKGSIALDGISLTIAALEGTTLSAAIIQHTFGNTALGVRRPGDRINIECDILAKYVAKMLGGYRRASSFPSVDEMREMGY